MEHLYNGGKKKKIKSVFLIDEVTQDTTRDRESDTHTHTHRLEHKTKQRSQRESVAAGLREGQPTPSLLRLTLDPQHIPLWGCHHLLIFTIDAI